MSEKNCLIIYLKKISFHSYNHFLIVADFAIAIVRVRIDLFALALVTLCCYELLRSYMLHLNSRLRPHSACKQRKRFAPCVGILWNRTFLLIKPRNLAIADRCNFFGWRKLGPLSTISLDLPLYSLLWTHTTHYNERNDYIEILSISVILSKM